jgi:hypothetical protein
MKPEVKKALDEWAGCSKLDSTMSIFSNWQEQKRGGEGLTWKYVEDLAQSIWDTAQKQCGLDCPYIDGQIKQGEKNTEICVKEASTQTAKEIFDYQMERLEAVRKHLKTLPTLSQDDLLELKGKKMTIWFKGMEVLLSLELLPSMKKKYGVK